LQAERQLAGRARQAASPSPMSAPANSIWLPSVFSNVERMASILDPSRGHRCRIDLQLSTGHAIPPS
jgi:hypothetical protein